MPHPPRGGLLLYAASASPVYHTQLKPRGSYSLKAPFHLILFLGGVGLVKSKPRSTHTLRKHCTPVLSPSPGISLRSRSSTWLARAGRSSSQWAVAPSGEGSTVRVSHCTVCYGLTWDSCILSARFPEWTCSPAGT